MVRPRRTQPRSIPPARWRLRVGRANRPRATSPASAGASVRRVPQPFGGLLRRVGGARPRTSARTSVGQAGFAGTGGARAPPAPSLTMRALVEDFLQHLRNERGAAENTQQTYFALLLRFVAWAEKQGLKSWSDVRVAHLLEYLQHERGRRLAHEAEHSTRRLSSESVYLAIAALRAFCRWAEEEKHLPANVAESLSLPRRWQRLPKALSDEEMERLLRAPEPATPASLCDQA